MKTSDTRSNFATTGLGKRLDPEPPMWFLAKVTAVAVSGGFNVYTLVEVEPVNTAYGYQTKPGGVTVTRAQELNNATVTVNTIVIARVRGWNTVGETYEFFVGSGGSPPTDLEDRKCVRVVTDVECRGDGGLEVTYKWLMIPRAWVLDTPTESCEGYSSFIGSQMGWVVNAPVQIPIDQTGGSFLFTNGGGDGGGPTIIPGAG